MQDGVLNLCRVKLRDQQRLAHGPLKEYTQFGQGIPFGEATPRAGNDSGGGQPGVILKCKGWETDPNAYIYFITQAPVWEKICDLIGEPDWKTHPDYAKPPARLPRLKQIFERIEQWTMTKTKFEVMNECNALDIPVGPILSMKEIWPRSRRCARPAPSSRSIIRRAASTCRSATRSSSPTRSPRSKRSPLLGEHTDEILSKVLKFTSREIAEIKASGATGEAPKAPQARPRSNDHAHRGPWPAGLRQGRAGGAAEARRRRRRRLCRAGEARPEGRSSQGSGARGQAAGLPAGVLPQARGRGRSSRR